MGASVHPVAMQPFLPSVRTRSVNTAPIYRTIRGLSDDRLLLVVKLSVTKRIGQFLVVATALPCVTAGN